MVRPVDAAEPYRLEGKKTLGYEIAEQLDWTLPDVIVYPTGGGTGLIGMWKAFEEMEYLGLIETGEAPSHGRSPSGRVRADRRSDGDDSAEAAPWPDPRTYASGLCVRLPWAMR